MSDTAQYTKMLAFPLTDFICALYKMPLDTRKQASAERAAARYDLPVKLCQAWINEARKGDELWPKRGGKR